MSYVGHLFRWWGRRLLAAVLLPFLLTFDLLHFSLAAVFGPRPVFAVAASTAITIAIFAAAMRALTTEVPAAAAASANEVMVHSNTSIITIQVDLQFSMSSAIVTFVQACSLALCSIGVFLTTTMQVLFNLNIVIVALTTLLSAWLMQIA